MTTRPDLARALGSGPPRAGDGSRFGHLVDVQFWLIGRDVEHPGGNLLQRLGFVREPAVRPGLPSSYRRAEANGRAVIWSCGMFLEGSRGRCLLVRGQEPRTLCDGAVADLRDPAEVLVVAGGQAAAGPPVLALASRWFAAYERDVEGLTGVEHRVPRPGTAPALAPPEPWSLAGAWAELAADLEAAGPKTAGRPSTTAIR